jgi:succinate dehydrogenase / fumarate reductase cytochrome b subunit
MQKINKDIKQKATMVILGLIWIFYLLFHAISNLSFFAGEGVFNDFYNALENSILWQIVPIILIFSLFYHAIIAIIRQLKNNKAREFDYKKPYPKAIPRVIAWSGALSLLGFIVIHFVQMKLIEGENLHVQITDILSNPIWLIIYIIGTSALIAHLHHGLPNITTSLGVDKEIDKKISRVVIFTILLILAVGFFAIPLSLIL